MEKKLFWFVLITLVVSLLNLYLLMEHVKLSVDHSTSEAGRSLGGDGG